MTLAWFDRKQPAVVRIDFSRLLSLFRSCGHRILQLAFYLGYYNLSFAFQSRLLSRTYRLRLKSGTHPTTLLKPCRLTNRGLSHTDRTVFLFKTVSGKPKTIHTILITCHTRLKKLKIWKCRYGSFHFIDCLMLQPPLRKPNFRFWFNNLSIIKGYLSIKFLLHVFYMVVNHEDVTYILI